MSTLLAPSSLDYFKNRVRRMTELEYDSWFGTSTAGSEFQWVLPQLEKLAAKVHFPIRYSCPDRELNRNGNSTIGLCSRSRFDENTGLIFLKPTLSPNELVRVGFHELTHALGAAEDFPATDEVTAETTAYLVCKSFGLDTWNFSFPYVGGHWHALGEFDDGAILGYTRTILNQLEAL